MAASKVELSAEVVDETTVSVSGFGADKPCKRVYLMAPVEDDGTPSNTSPVRFGKNALTNYDWIAIDGSRDKYVNVSNLKLLYFRIVTANDVVRVRLEN